MPRSQTLHQRADGLRSSGCNEGSNGLRQNYHDRHHEPEQFLQTVAIEVSPTWHIGAIPPSKKLKFICEGHTTTKKDDLGLGHHGWMYGWANGWIGRHSISSSWSPWKNYLLQKSGEQFLHLSFVS